MTLCPHTHHQCHCQPQEGMECPYGPTPPYPKDEDSHVLTKTESALLDEIAKLRSERDAALATAADRNRERLEQDGVLSECHRLLDEAKREPGPLPARVFRLLSAQQAEQEFHNVDDVALLRKVLDSGRLTGHALADEIRAHLRGEIEPGAPREEFLLIQRAEYELQHQPECYKDGSVFATECAKIDCAKGKLSAWISRHGGAHSEFDPSTIPDCPSCRVAHWPQCPPTGVLRYAEHPRSCGDPSCEICGTAPEKSKAEPAVCETCRRPWDAHSGKEKVICSSP